MKSGMHTPIAMERNQKRHRRQSQFNVNQVSEIKIQIKCG